MKIQRKNKQDIRNIIKTNKAITLIALVVTIIVLIILASVTAYSGISTIKSSKLNKFKQELEIMQSEVNLLYEKYKDEEIIEIGKKIPAEKTELATKAFDNCDVNEEDKTSYKLFDSDVIKELNIEGIEREYLVNIKQRNVICLEGVESEGKIYYNLAQLTDKNIIEEGIERGDVTFDISVEQDEEGCLVIVSNIKFSKYVGKGTIKYQNLETNKTTTIEKEAKENQSYSFTIQNEGTYKIQVVDAAGIIAEKEETIKIAFYEVDGTLYYKRLTEAIGVAQEGSTIKVLKNATETEAITISKDIILDTNGKTINYEKGNNIMIEANKNVVIKGNGTISGDTNASFIVNHGNLETNEVTIESTASGYLCSTITNMREFNF